MAKSDLDLAITVWDKGKHTIVLNDQTAQQLERRLALALAHAQDKRAYDRLNQLMTVDGEVREWKVRAALLELNWSNVTHALAGLTIEEKQTPQWQYWQARSLVETGNVPQGQSIYNRLSEDRSYYGFLAADSVNKPYSFANKPVNIAGNVLEELAQTTDFKVIQELTNLNREEEAKRQWWFALKKLPKEQLIVAAKLAQQWRWDQIAIITLVKADYWDDLGLRFPVTYLNQVQNNAYLQGLDPAIIFGLIRQESMLDKSARSAVGARGLMQIMPETGQQIAHNFNEPWQAENSLFNPDINIKYGSFYYKQLLNRFDGHFALATAAYNAGPNRVIKWLPSHRSLPADIWIETIPYKETRKYVTSVLSYAIIYQQQLKKSTLKMTKLLFDVRPH
jgi:soluble lytic murein transglycosylase